MRFDKQGSIVTSHRVYSFNTGSEYLLRVLRIAFRGSTGCSINGSGFGLHILCNAETDSKGKGHFESQYICHHIPLSFCSRHIAAQPMLCNFDNNNNFN